MVKQPEWQRGGICGALSSTSQHLNLEPTEQRERERGNSADTFSLAIAEPLPSKIELYCVGHTSEHMHIEQTIGACSAVIYQGRVSYR